MLRMIAMLVAALGFSVPAFTKEVSMKELLPSYISVQEALSADNFLLAQEKAKGLQKQVQEAKGLQEINLNLSTFISAKSIQDARKEFKKISAPFVKWIEINKDSNFEIVYCPMAGAKWIQKKGEVMNPYYGGEMLHCGEKIL